MKWLDDFTEEELRSYPLAAGTVDELGIFSNCSCGRTCSACEIKQTLLGAHDDLPLPGPSDDWLPGQYCAVSGTIDAQLQETLTGLSSAPNGVVSNHSIQTPFPQQGVGSICECMGSVVPPSLFSLPGNGALPSPTYHDQFAYDVHQTSPSSTLPPERIIKKPIVGTKRLLEASFKRRKKDAKFQCPYRDSCKATFTSSHNRDYHINSHQGIKPYLCKKGCPYSATSPATVRRHERTCDGHRL